MTARFGVGLPNGFPVGEPSLDFLPVAERAEELGWDSAWVSDHVVFHVPRLEVFATLAAVAARTRRIEIGTGVLLLAPRNPVHVAQTTATLDRLSNGRFVLGVGVGGEHPKEFAASGVPVSERGARTDEALDALCRLWTGERVDFAGRFHRFEGVAMPLRPVRRPPLWIGGRAPAALRRTARIGDAWFPAFVTPARYRESLAELDRLAAERGRDPRSIGRALFLFACTSGDAAAARGEAEAFLTRNYAMPFAPLEPYAVVGAPEPAPPYQPPRS